MILPSPGRTAGTVSRASSVAGFVSSLEILLRDSGIPGVGDRVGIRAIVPRGDDSLVAILRRPEEKVGAGPRFGVVIEPQASGTFLVSVVEAARDAELPGLRHLLEAGPEGVDGIAASGLGVVREIRWRSYRPTRRAQLEAVHAGGRSSFLRIERPRKIAARCSSYRRTVALLTAAADPRALRALRAPRVLGVDEERGILALEGLPGELLLGVLARPGCRDALRRVGRALRAFHAIDAPEREAALPEFGWEEGIADVCRYRRALERIGSRDADPLRTMIARLGDSPPPAGVRSVLHRDLHEKQVLLGRDVGIVDCDRIGFGDPCSDVGNLMAHFRLRVLQGLTRAPVAALRRALTEGYGTPAGEAGEDRTRAWEAMSLARLAGVYSLRPRWSHMAPKLLGIAAQLQGRRERPGKVGGRRA